MDLILLVKFKIDYIYISDFQDSLTVLVLNKILNFENTKYILKTDRPTLRMTLLVNNKAGLVFSL